MVALLALIQDSVSSIAGPVRPSPVSSPESDREALNAFNCHTFVSPNGWFSDAPLTEWKGVTVDNAGRVIALQIRHYDYTDYMLETLPAEIGQLTQLQHLTLDGNRLKMLPVEIGYLTQLQHLDLHDNKLETLPVEIGQLTQLQDLDLSEKQVGDAPCRDKTSDLVVGS